MLKGVLVLEVSGCQGCRVMPRRCQEVRQNDIYGIGGNLIKRYRLVLSLANKIVTTKELLGTLLRY
jgi:hypothetical protein